MAEGFTLVVATVGGGLSRTVDGGETWDRIRDPIPSESNIRALSVYPDNPIASWPEPTWAFSAARTMRAPGKS